VQVVNLPQEKIAEWKGEHDYSYRLKIKVIEEMVHRHPDVPLLFLDCDTFLYHDVVGLKRALTQGKAILHVQEGKLSELKSKTEKRMWSRAAGLQIGSIQINQDHAMWNSGVIGLPATKNKEAVSLALQICDTLCRHNVPMRLIEQFSVSVALQESYTLAPAYEVIGHYWGNKEQWNKEISGFFLESYLKNSSVEEDLVRIRHFNFDKLAMVRRVKKTRQRLERLIGTMFPSKETLRIGDSAERKA